MSIVKFCGFKQVEDVEQAISVGCDLVGLNFVEASPRYINIQDAATICQTLKNRMLFVGVFMNHAENEVFEVLDSVKLSFLQFHGAESPEFCRSFDRPYIKSFHVNAEFDFDEARKSYEDAFAWMLDTPSPLGGGSGRSFDWSRFPIGESHVFLSGGLSDANVQEALNACKPWGVDVASGIEEESHQKSHQKMIRFMDAIRYA